MYVYRSKKSSRVSFKTYEIKMVTVSAGITILESKNSFIQKSNAIYIILLNHTKAVFSHFLSVFTHMFKPVKPCLKPYREHTPHKYSIKSTKSQDSCTTHCIQYKYVFPSQKYSHIQSFFLSLCNFSCSVIKNSPKPCLAIDSFVITDFPFC